MRYFTLDSFRSWPEGVSSGLVSTCSRCKAVPDFDYLVDWEFWNWLVPAEERAGVICLSCLDEMAEEAGAEVGQHLREVQFTGCRSTVFLVPTLTIRREILREQAAATPGRAV